MKKIILITLFLSVSTIYVVNDLQALKPAIKYQPDGKTQVTTIHYQSDGKTKDYEIAYQGDGKTIDRKVNFSDNNQ